MKSPRFLSLLLWAALVCGLVSCGGNDADTDTDTATTDTINTTDTTTMASQPTAAPAIDTTPIQLMLIRQKVRNFAAWKPTYDARDSIRQANGLHNYVLGRGVEDTSSVLIALRADDMEKAKAYSKNPELRQAMQKGGVVGAPAYHFLITTYRNTATDNSPLRSLAWFTVKDWATWRSGFESGRAEREANGLTDRAYGHDVDNDRKVLVSFAITDSAKARAYWNSDGLKQRRTAAGVTGEPQRFMYRVVQ
jgi:hypothetical protein